MTPAQQHYLAIETAIAAVVNGVLSLLFALAVFGGQRQVPVTGLHGLAMDAVPQNLMVVLMSALVPTVLTRRRIAAGRIAGPTGDCRRARHALVGALRIAIPVAVVAGLVQAVILPSFGAHHALGTVLVWKTVYGAVLGAIVARHAVRSVLAGA